MDPGDVTDTIQKREVDETKRLLREESEDEVKKREVDETKRLLREESEDEVKKGEVDETKRLVREGPEDEGQMPRRSPKAHRKQIGQALNRIRSSSQRSLAAAEGRPLTEQTSVSKRNRRKLRVQAKPAVRVRRSRSRSSTRTKSGRTQKTEETGGEEEAAGVESRVSNLETRVDEQPKTGTPNTTDSQIPTTGSRVLGSNGTYDIKHRLGKGGFGYVYLCTCKKKEFAIKVEDLTKNGNSSTFDIESDVLRAVQSKKHFVDLIDEDSSSHYTFIVMSLLGLDLDMLRRSDENDPRFTVSTVLRVTLQVLEGVETLHSAGYLHRDIKPQNIVCGLGDATRVLHVVDFGLACKWKDQDGNLIRPGRRYCGTVRYAALAAHQKQPQCRRDDLESLLYGMVELLAGELPWRWVKGRDAVMEEKRQFRCRGGISSLIDMPACYDELMRAIDLLADDDAPEYAAYNNLIMEELTRLGYKLSDKFDWEDGSSSHSTSSNREGSEDAKAEKDP